MKDIILAHPYLSFTLGVLWGNGICILFTNAIRYFVAKKVIEDAIKENKNE